jgi:hypothetical protein
LGNENKKCDHCNKPFLNRAKRYIIELDKERLLLSVGYINLINQDDSHLAKFILHNSLYFCSKLCFANEMKDIAIDSVNNYERILRSKRKGNN